jgi:predicted DNA-binding protein
MKPNKESKRLITEILERLDNNSELQGKFKDEKSKAAAISGVLKELIEEGHDVVLSKADLKALDALHLDKFVEGNKSKGSYFFGLVF